MKRVHIYVSGEVQGVGYREEVKRIAFDLNILGWVMNLEDGNVEILAEGNDKDIKQFSERIRIRRYPIFVQDVKVAEETYSGEFGSFKVIRDKDLQKEILSALSRGTVDIHEMKEVLQDVKQDTGAMLVKQDKMLEKQDKMLEKQDDLLEVTKSGFNEMKSGFAEVKEETHMLRDDFKEYFKREVSEIKSEIAEIKATLARMQAAG